MKGIVTSRKGKDEGGIMRVKIWLVCGILILFCILGDRVWAEEWKLYYETEPNLKYYFDKTGIDRPSKNVASVDIKIVEKQADDEEITKYTARFEFHCKERGYKILSIKEIDTVTGQEINYADGAQAEFVDANAKAVLSRQSTALFDNVCP